MKLGFIGAGNMAEAIIKGVTEKNVVHDVYACDISATRMQYIKDTYNINVCADADAVVRACDVTIIAVKPGVVRDVLGSVDCHGKAIISIVAGVSIDELKKHAPGNTRILRTMPNTPLMVGEGATAFALPTDFTDTEMEFADKLFSTLGVVVRVGENLIPQVTGLSGSGPAYVFMFIESLIDAGVKNGLPRDLATSLATQTVLGSAKTVLESGKHPAILRGDVSSPGGTTAQATSALEEKGFRHAVISAVDAATQKAREL